jgi:hypothetical protein
LFGAIDGVVRVPEPVNLKFDENLPVDTPANVRFVDPVALLKMPVPAVIVAATIAIGFPDVSNEN